MENVMQNELIKISTATVGGQELQTVDARELHEFLEVGRDFTNWVKDRIEQYSFEQGKDFEIFDSPNLANQTGRGGDRRSKLYVITLDMAKELAMVERNAKGKQARQYFIDCERKLHERPQVEAKPRQPRISGQPTVHQKMRIIEAYGKRLSKVVGANTGIIEACVARAIAIETSVDVVTHFAMVLPRPETALPGLNATALAEALGMGLTAKPLNVRLQMLGWQQRNDRNEWELTEVGKEFGEMIPFNKNGHSSWQILWKPTAKDALREALLKMDFTFANSEDGQKKEVSATLELP